MTDQDKPNSGNLMPAGRHDLAPVAAANPLVSRGLASIARLNEPFAALSAPLKLALNIPGVLYFRPRDFSTPVADTNWRLAGWQKLADTPAVVEVNGELHKKLFAGAFPAHRLESVFKLVSDAKTAEPGAEFLRIHAAIPLRSLELHHTRLTDVSFLQHLQGLEYLALQLVCRPFTDDDLGHLRCLTTLKELDCSGGRLVTDKGLTHHGPSGAWPPGWCDLLTDKGLTHLRDLSFLRVLRLYWSPEISDTGLVHVSALTHLDELGLVGCSVTGKGLAYLSALTRLRELDLACSSINDEGLVHLRNFRSLRVLTAHNCGEITDSGLVHLAALTQLEEIDLARCSVTGKGLDHLAGLTQLKVLNLSGCSVTDQGLAHLRGLSKLRHLCVSRKDIYGSCWYRHPQHRSVADRGEITDEGLAHLAGLSHLEDLELVGCSVTDKGLVHLAALTHLKALYLNQCPVTDKGLTHLSGLSNLRLLSLSDCTQITDEGLAHLAGLTQLEELFLDQCPVSDKRLTHLRAALPQCQISAMR